MFIATLASPSINARVNIDFNSTAMETIGSGLSLSSSSVGVGAAVTAPTTFTASSLYSKSHKAPYTRNGVKNGAINAGKASASAIGSTSSNPNGSWTISSSTTKLNSFKSTSKLPFDYTLTKKWTGSGKSDKSRRFYFRITEIP